MAYVVIDAVVLPVDTAEEIACAQATLRETGDTEAVVYAGSPDGLDSYATERRIFADD